MSEKPLCEIGYRYIPSYEMQTPLMHLPMQRMCINVAEPCGKTQVIEALLEHFGDDCFESRDSIHDIEVRKVVRNE